MSKIVIKKKVPLEFLGDEYKDAYLIFRSIPLADYTKLQDELPKTSPRHAELVTKAQHQSLNEQENNELIKLQFEEAEISKQSFGKILEYLKLYFHSGKFPNDETGELEDLDGPEALDGLDREAAIACFKTLTGQNNDPKVEQPSTMPSITDSPPPTSS